MTIHAVYENGVFRPTEPVDLPDRCQVEVEIRQVKETPAVPTLDDVYEILGRRHASGEHDLAERHNLAGLIDAEAHVLEERRDIML